MQRRSFLQLGAVTAAAVISNPNLQTEATAKEPIFTEDAKWKFRYMLPSCMYGYMYLGEIFPEVAKTGSEAIDIWPKVHGNQREQLDDLGEEKFIEMMTAASTKLGCITQYKLGPFGLQNEMKLAERLGCGTIVTGGSGPKGLRGSELKTAVYSFVEKMKPHLDIAAASGIEIAIENHGNNLIESPDSLKWLAEFSATLPLSIALAPYHLPQDEIFLADLVKSLGEKMRVFYAWQHGMGCMQRLPKDQELLQMPGRGALDFGPIVAALRETNYQGWTEIFMHPVPRGIPILETAAEVTAEILRAKDYLESFLV